MAAKPAEKLLGELLDERVHLLIRINLVENSGSDAGWLPTLLKRKLELLEKQIDEIGRTIGTDWRARALIRGETR